MDLIRTGIGIADLSVQITLPNRNNLTRGRRIPSSFSYHNYYYHLTNNYNLQRERDDNTNNASNTNSNNNTNNDNNHDNNDKNNNNDCESSVILYLYVITIINDRNCNNNICVMLVRPFMIVILEELC